MISEPEETNGTLFLNLPFLGKFIDETLEFLFWNYQRKHHETRQLRLTDP